MNSDYKRKLTEILEPILIKLYHNGYTDHMAGLSIHAEAVKDQWLKEAREQLNALLLETVEAVIGTDIVMYQPYLVASKKLDIAHNQTQARMIVECINRTKAEQRQKAKELINAGEGE